MEVQMVNGPAQVLLRAVLAGQTAIDDTVHPTEDHLGLIGHEEITTVDPRLHQNSAGRTGVVEMGRACLCLLHTRLATAKVVTVGTAIETEPHLAMFTFLLMKEHDPERNLAHETLTRGLLAEMVDVDPETLGTREMVLPTIVRTGAGASGTGTERVTHATLEETGEMVERAHEVPSEETGHASEIETFTGGRIVCTSNPHRYFDWVGLEARGEGVCLLYRGGSGFMVELGARGVVKLFPVQHAWRQWINDGHAERRLRGLTSICTASIYAQCSHIELRQRVECFDT